MKKSALLLSVVMVGTAVLAVANEALKPSPVQQLDLTPQAIESDDTRNAEPPAPVAQHSEDETAALFSPTGTE